MSKTKIVVFQMKEIIYTSVLAVLGVIIVILLCILIGGRGNGSSGGSTTPNETAAADTYHAGTYSAELALGNSVLNMEVTVDPSRIKSVKLTNINESVTTMFPLLTPSLENIQKQLINGTAPDEIILSEDNRYTETLLLDSIKGIIEQARVTE